MAPAVFARAIPPGKATLTYRLSAKSPMLVRVSNSSGHGKQVFKGTVKAGIKRVTWDGKDSNGTNSPDGTYTFRIYRTTSKGILITPALATANVRLDTKNPFVSISDVSTQSISAAVDGSLTVTFRSSDSIALPTTLTATLQILDGDGDVVVSVPRGGVQTNKVATVAWGGRLLSGLKASAGRYSVRVKVVDAAGNSTISKSTFVWISNLGYPRAMTNYGATGGSIVRMDVDALGNTHLAYNDSKYHRIYYRRLDSDGNTIVGPVLLGSAPDDVDSSANPDVAGTPDGGAYVVWRGYTYTAAGTRTTKRALKLVRFDAPGRLAWGKSILDMSSAYGTNGYADARIDAGPDGLAHVVCRKVGSPIGIYYSSYQPDGNVMTGWSSIADTKRGGKRLPNVQVDALNRVHIVWLDSRGSADAAKCELYYTRLAFQTIGGRPVPSEQTISEKRLTTYAAPTTIYDWAPELASAADGTLHVAWTYRVSGVNRKILYAKVGPSGTKVGGDRVVTETGGSNVPVLYAIRPCVVTNGTGASVLFTAGLPSGSSWGGNPRRIMKVDVPASGSPGAAMLLTNAGHNGKDVLGGAGTGPDGRVRVTYDGFREYKSGSVYLQPTYIDAAVDACSNDCSRSDFEIDMAHLGSESSRRPPRWGTPVDINVTVHNAGWTASHAGVLVLENRGAEVARTSFSALGVEQNRQVTVRWIVPETTSTVETLTMRVLPADDSTQTTAENDVATGAIYIELPPERIGVIASIYDETLDEDREDWWPVYEARGTLTGVTSTGTPVTMTDGEGSSSLYFPKVPPGTYQVSVVATGLVPSGPYPQAVTVTRNPSDPYELIVTPSQRFKMYMNRWGGVLGRVESLEGTAIAGAKLTFQPFGRAETSGADGAFTMAKVIAGTYQVKALADDFARTTVTHVVTAGATETLLVPMQPTSKGYLEGALTDDDTGEYLAGSKLEVWQGPSRVFSATSEDGTFSTELAEGSYTVKASCPGYINKSEALTVHAGREYGLPALTLDVSDYKARGMGPNFETYTTWKQEARFNPDKPDKPGWLGWILGTPVYANDPIYKAVEGLEFPSYFVDVWWGRFKYRLNLQYQDVGTNRYVRTVSLSFLPDRFFWDRVSEAEPEENPFEEYTDPRNWKDVTAYTFSPYWTNLLVDGIRVQDDRDRSYAVNKKQQVVMSQTLQTPYPTYTFSPTQLAYSKAVPWKSQVLKILAEVGQISPTGGWESAPFHDIPLQMEGLHTTTGYYRIVFNWDLDANKIWIEPCLIDYPERGP